MYFPGHPLRDPSTSQTCLNKETAVTWNQTGPQGPAGPSPRYLTFGVYHPSDGTIDATIDPSRSDTSATVSNVSAMMSYQLPSSIQRRRS